MDNTVNRFEIAKKSFEETDSWNGTKGQASSFERACEYFFIHHKQAVLEALALAQSSLRVEGGTDAPDAKVYLYSLHPSVKGAKEVVRVIDNSLKHSQLKDDGKPIEGIEKAINETPNRPVMGNGGYGYYLTISEETYATFIKCATRQLKRQGG